MLHESETTSGRSAWLIARIVLQNWPKSSLSFSMNEIRVPGGASEITDCTSSDDSEPTPWPAPTLVTCAGGVEPASPWNAVRSVCDHESCSSSETMATLSGAVPLSAEGRLYSDVSVCATTTS